MTKKVGAAENPILHGHTSHGLHTLRKAVRVLGSRTIDRRTVIGRALEEWRHDLLNDLGGIEHTSTQQRQIVDQAVKTKLILDSIDAWMVQQSSLVNKRRRALYHIVLQRQTLADALARYMTMIGLERRAKTVQPLQDYLRERYGKPAEKENGSDQSDALTTSEEAAPS